MKTKECMCQKAIIAHPENTIEDCSKLMEQNQVGCLPVCNETNQIVGIITDRDIVLRGIACQKNPKSTQVSEIMTTHVCCCNAEDNLEQAEQLMRQNHIRRLPVMENNKIIGVLTIGDLAENENISCDCVGETLEDICCNHNQNNK